jgi:hypothetical protein
LEEWVAGWLDELLHRIIDEKVVVDHITDV